MRRGSDMSPTNIGPAAPTDRTILDLFAEQVRVRPRAIAVTSQMVDITYGDLDELSNRIAAWLVERGVGAEDIVAVEVKRGHALVAALVGVLKAGAAYLALELDMPRLRRDRLIADAGARALITMMDQPERPPLPTLRLPDKLDQLAAGGPAMAVRARPDGLAYICYTSGSMGWPKPVGVPHRGVTRLVAGDYAELGLGHTLVALSPVSFDASTFEIWGALLSGGRVVMQPRGPAVAEDLAAVLRDEKVTTLFLTTALFHRMVDHDLDAFADVQQLITGGEVLDPARINRFRERFPHSRLVAAYGPTENTTFTTCHTIVEPVATSWVPLGRPIAGTAVHVLDERLQPVPPGTPGELCVAGVGVGRGYLGQPAATALSFVPDPFGAPGSTMYRTGDVVRQSPSGELEFIGRGDRQVKIRGFRVEPAEVEREIAAIAGVKDSVVVTHGERLEEKRLTAYLVPQPGDDDPDGLPARVRRRLRTSLPIAMIPAAFVTLNELPLNQNGKIDRAALPVPQRTARAADGEFVGPRSAIETLLCDMWAELLKLDAVGALDDFFELGGNSLLAIDLMNRAETVFDIELPVRALLYHPTVEEFARAIDALRGSARE